MVLLSSALRASVSPTIIVLLWGLPLPEVLEIPGPRNLLSLSLLWGDNGGTNDDQGLAPGPALRNHFWQCLGNHIEC